MSHRKFEQPRHGSLAFLPRKRTRHHRGKVKAFPKDDAKSSPHLTAFMGYKAGMSHIVRTIGIKGTKLYGQEVVEAVTVIETPPMVVVGVVGYVNTPTGLKSATTVMAPSLSDSFRRRLYRTWRVSKKETDKKKAFSKYIANTKPEDIEAKLTQIAETCDVVRVIAHTQLHKVHFAQKKAHVMEIQINGGSTADKISFARAMLETEIVVDSVFAANEMIDIMGATNGRGFQGTIKRWGVKRLARKTHRGLRKVACIGAWHPSRVAYTIPRAGQCGYHHRVEINKKVYRLDDGASADSGNTKADITRKSITPMGGFPHYGTVRNQFLMLKGSTVGCVRRVLTLRKSLGIQVSPVAQEQVELSFIDTSSKHGRGRFQTKEEKQKFFGKLKKHTTKSTS